ncbi:MAG: methyltransferase domain-containing protein [Blastocatellia bacterium]|jgi:SAM-dependent methyltransferase|nr:methyltransferase domain-containing protein [Blastocatellia bacterium]MBK6425206.1 methyltransferase domain-containing protein [Blastocatellia bacterium]
MDEHFRPEAGLELDDYVRAGDTNAVWHLIRYLWALEYLADQPSIARLLDLGCGAGYGTYLIASRFPEVTVLGVDYDPAAIEAARAAYSLPNLRFALGDATQWEATIGNDIHDCIVSFDAIEHIEHRELVMQGIVEHLSPAGVLLLSTPCAWASPVLKPGWEFHKIEYSLATLFDMLRRYFGRLLRPDDGSLPHVEVFDRLAGTGMEYLLLLNPVVCERPILIDNPYRASLPDETQQNADGGLRGISGDWGAWGYDMPGLVDIRTGLARLFAPGDVDGETVEFDIGVSGNEWQVVAGDWDADGIDTIGALNTETGEVLLLARNEPGAQRITFQFEGACPTSLLLAGDWDGDGTDTLGLFDPETRVFRLKDSNADGPHDRAFVFGPELGGMRPVAGDWSSAGVDSVGVYSPSSAKFYLRIAERPDDTNLFINFGVAGCLPIAGDWNGDGIDTIGVCNLADRQIYLRNSHSPGPADVCIPIPSPVHD